MNVSEYQEFIKGTDAVVDCPAFFGDPPGHMIWIRDDRSFTDNRFTLEDGRMRIQNIRETDEAIYRCSIFHLGIVDSRYITVAVLERSKLAPKIIEQNPIEVRYGDPLDLTCELEVQRDNIDYMSTLTLKTVISETQLPLFTEMQTIILEDCILVELIMSMGRMNKSSL